MTKTDRAIQAMPKIPSLSEIQVSDNPKELFDDYERRVNEARAHNDRVFQKDLKLMKRCDYLRGALGRHDHFAWCPRQKWDEYWQSVGWPALDITY